MEGRLSVKNEMPGDGYSNGRRIFMSRTELILKTGRCPGLLGVMKQHPMMAKARK
jgi:hypothetical protein